MTPVATPIALRAITWDAALAETLSRAATDVHPPSVLARSRPDRAAPTAAAVRVHSVHRRAVNLRVGDELVALVSAALDDAPSTVRVPVEDWTALAVRQGDPASIGPDGFRIETVHGPIAVLTSSATAWAPSEICLCALSGAQLLRSEERIAAIPVPPPQSAFGIAAATLLAARVSALGDALRQRDPSAVTAAAARLLGLGEGLTPSGDDVLTGLAFVSAHRGTRLHGALASLAAALDDEEERTTLLSVATLRHALEARAQQGLHDLIRAVRDGDGERIGDAALRVARIGHTSGTDMLSGVRLALRTEAALRSASTPLPATASSGIVPKEHA
jgi:Protein of unknown function (DUF2877)